MKILYIIDKMTQLAGIERILTCKMNYLAKKTEHSVFLSTYDQQKKPLSFALDKRIKYCPFNAPLPVRSGTSLIKWLLSYIQARQTFKKEFHGVLCSISPDIVICTGYAYPILDIIIDTCYKAKVKIIMESHVKSDTVSMTNYAFNHTISHLLSVWDCHIKKSLQRCNCVVTLTQDDKALWMSHATRIEVIPNMLTITPKSVIDYRAKRVIAVGRYVRQKGYDLLLEAWRLIGKDLNGWDLYIFGNEDRGPYQQIVDNFGIHDSVHLLPATQNIVEEFSKSSIFVLSSRFEGFALVLLEAMSCGLPCVSFDCPYGPSIIISNKQDGFLVENGNAKALAQALQQLMLNDTLRQEMGEKAAQIIVRYSPEEIMRQWNELFKSL